MARPRYTLITGEFYILYTDLPRNGPEPDGDTINFLPDNDDLVLGLPRFNDVPPDRKHLGTYGVRFEGIDTLETHFENLHQNLEFGRAARDRMLALMGFGQVDFWADRPNKVQAAENHPIPGYLLANGIESNGRVLALVYPGSPPASVAAADGDPAFVDTELLEMSLNAALVREGLAYGELYSTMPLDLIDRLHKMVAMARENDAGIWPREHITTTARIPLHGLAELTDLIIFPKLYRRLVKYFKAGHADLAAFDTWIRADPRRDDEALLPTGEIGNLHDLYNIDASGILLRHRPEDLTFT